MLTADGEDISDHYFTRFNKSHYVFDTSWSTLSIKVDTAGGVSTYCTTLVRSTSCINIQINKDIPRCNTTHLSVHPRDSTHCQIACSHGERARLCNAAEQAAGMR